MKFQRYIHLNANILLAVSFLITFWSINKSKAGDCSDILQSGFHNTYSSIDKSRAREAYKSALCDEKSSLHKNGTDVSLGGSYFEVIKGNGSYSQNTSDELSSKYCKSKSGDIDDDDFHKLLVMTIDPLVVTSWRECMSSQGKGLFGNVDTSGDTVTFTLEWQGFAGVSRVTVLKKPFTANLKDCDGTISRGEKLESNTSITESCTRVSGKEVIYVVNTTGGSKTFKLSSLIQKVKPSSVYRYISTTPYTPPPIALPTGPTEVDVVSVGKEKHFSVKFTAPAMPQGAGSPFGATPEGDKPVFRSLRFVAFKNGSPYGSGTVSLGNLQGAWEPGQPVEAQFDAPASYTSAAGWKMTYCIGLSESPCLTGTDLLVGEPR